MQFCNWTSMCTIAEDNHFTADTVCVSRGPWDGVSDSTRFRAQRFGRQELHVSVAYLLAQTKSLCAEYYM